jgi:hypothetical protein
LFCPGKRWDLHLVVVGSRRHLVLWSKLWRSGKNLSVYSLRVNDSMDCILGGLAYEFQILH